MEARGPSSAIEREPVNGPTTSLAGSCSHPVPIAQDRPRSGVTAGERAAAVVQVARSALTAVECFEERADGR